MTATPISTAAKTLSQQFLDAYLADPVKNPWGQFYKTASTGSAAGDLNQSFQKYGAIVNPLELAAKTLSGATSPLGSVGAVHELRKAAQSGGAAFKDLREQNYNTYKETYGKAEDLYRQMREKGFASEEEKQRAQQGLAAVREATFTPYLANRAYLETQEALSRAGYSRARGQARDAYLKERFGSNPFGRRAAGPFGGIGVKEEQGLQMAYDAVKNIGQGGAVTNYPMLSLGESLGRMMREPSAQLSEQNWREKYRDGQPAGVGAGYASRFGGEQTSAVSAAPTQAAPAAVRQGPIQSLDLSRGGSAERFNMADLRAARQEGYSDKQIRQYIKKNEGLVGEGKRERIMRALRG